jgi:hypothetical protein
MLAALMAIAALFARRRRMLREWQRSYQQQSYRRQDEPQDNRQW